MSSSYVEVRDRENGMDDLEFQVNDYESNGLDIQTHFDGGFPKDHTYNKDPTSDVEFLLAQSKKIVESTNNEEAPKKIKRSHRNVKHKIIKPRNEDGIAVEAVEENKKDSSKLAVNDEPVIKESLIVPPEITDPVIKPSDTVAETDFSKKRNRKRKIDEDFTTLTETVAKKESSVKQTKKKKVKEENGETPLVAPKKEETKEAKDDNPKKKPKPIKKVEKASKKEVAEVQKTKVVEVQKTKPKSSVKKDEKGESIPQLPPGWTRKVVERKSGKTAGMFDVYIYSPEGIKFRSRPDVAAYLMRTKSKLKIEDFVFKRSVHLEKKSSEKPAQKEPTKPKNKKKAKKGAKLKVKLSTPKRPNKITTDSIIESQPSTSGHQTKRTEVTRRKKNT